jgi:hypothetical protein
MPEKHHIRRLVTYIDILTESYFAAELALETRAYVERGRSLEGSSDQNVLESSTAHSSRDRALANPVRKGNNRFG